MKKYLKEWGYDIFFFALIIGMVAGIWIWKNIDRTKEIRQWIQSLDEDRMTVVVEQDKYTLSLQEKKKLLSYLKSMDKDDIELLKSTDSRSNGTEFYLEITLEGKRYLLWKSFIVSGDALIEYKGKDYWLVCDGLKEFLQQLYQKAEQSLIIIQ
ncbi:MAG: hypothetical protein HFI34_10625 [Lachnospiraceae bacterium]|nr:hypothetical protein [Lachnospiraceae bacterium]